MNKYSINYTNGHFLFEKSDYLLYNTYIFTNIRQGDSNEKCQNCYALLKRGKNEKK